MVERGSSIVLAAGSFMHFALAFVLLFILAVGIGVASNNTTIGNVDPCVPRNVQALDSGSVGCAAGQPASPAKVAGIQPNDKIISVAGQRVSNWTQLGTVIRKQPAGKPVPVVVQRGGRDVALTVIPASVSGRSGSYLGI